MPRAIFTSSVRDTILAANVFRTTRHLKASRTEDQFEIGGCRVTCRYRTRRGDFVCDQVLGCWNAIRTGRLRCKQKKAAVAQVLRTQTILGMVGPDDEVEKLAHALAEQFSGIVVTAKEAIVAG